MPVFHNIFKKSSKASQTKTREKTKGDRTHVDSRTQKKETAPKGSTVGKVTKKVAELKQGAAVVKTERAHGAYQIIVKPHISEKSIAQTDQGKYVFEVDSRANAQLVRHAIEYTYGVDVLAVNMLKVPYKKKRFRRIESRIMRHNKAIVTLRSGQTIEVLPQ